MIYTPNTNFTPPVSVTETTETLALFDFSLNQSGLVSTDLTGNRYDVVWASPATQGPGR